MSIRQAEAVLHESGSPYTLPTVGSWKLRGG
jgi:hypothetical protein